MLNNGLVLNVSSLKPLLCFAYLSLSILLSCCHSDTSSSWFHFSKDCFLFLNSAGSFSCSLAHSNLALLFLSLSGVLEPFVFPFIKVSLDCRQKTMHKNVLHSVRCCEGVLVVSISCFKEWTRFLILSLWQICLKFLCPSDCISNLPWHSCGPHIESFSE